MKTKRQFLSPPRQWGPIRRALGVWLVTWMAFASPAAFAIDYFVSPTGNDANPGTAAQPWRSITRALNQTLTPHATTGDNVNVAGGTYDTLTETFPLSLVNGVALKGAGSTQSLVVGDGSTPLFRTSGTDLTPATVVDAFNFTDDNATSNFSSDIMVFDLNTNTMSPTITTNAFNGFTQQSGGIRINGGTGGTFDSLIDGNSFQNLSCGVCLRDQSDGTVRPLTDFSPVISNNTFTSNRSGVDLTGYQMLMTGSASATFAPSITTNQFSFGQYGIFIDEEFTRIEEGASFVYGPNMSGNTISNMTSGAAIQATLLESVSSSAVVNDHPSATDNIISNIHEIDGAGGAGIRIGTRSIMSGTAQLTSAHTITGNTLTRIDAEGIENRLSLSLSSGAPAVATPLITTNTLTHIGNGAISMEAEISASSSAQAQFDPTISNNTMRDVGNGVGLLWLLSGSASGASLKSNATVTGNQIIPATSSTDSAGFDVSSRNFGIAMLPLVNSWASLDANWTISGNTVTGANADGIHLFGGFSSSVSSSANIANNTGTFSLAISGNTLTNNDGLGLDVNLRESAETGLAQTVLIDNNTATNNGGGTGLGFLAKGTSSGFAANDIQITRNQITGNLAGMSVASSQVVGGANAVLVSCNTVSGNQQDGVVQGALAPAADYGGGNRNSPGNNQFFGNSTAAPGHYDFVNQGIPAGQTIFAHNNYWGTTDPPTIESHIFDDTDDPTLAPVDFSNPLAAPPTSCGLVANNPPVAVNDSYSTPENTLLTVIPPGVLGNDTDIDGNTLTAIEVAGPSNGVLNLNPNGSFTYQPNPNFSGVDSFTYQASDGSASSNVATVTINVTPAAGVGDLRIVKTGPASIPSNGNITFRITITNLGPSQALNITVNDQPDSNLRFLSNTGACTTPFPCTIPTLAVGAQAVINSSFRTGGASQVTNSASVSSSGTSDPNPSNNTSRVTVGTPCLSGAPEVFTPFRGQTDAAISGNIQFTAVGADVYEIYFGPAGTGCSTLAGTTSTTSFPYKNLLPNTDYEVRVNAVKSGCPSLSSQCMRFHTAGPPCNPPTAPLAGVVAAPSSGRPYSVVVVSPSTSDSTFEYDEATNDQFTDAKTNTTDATSFSYVHTTDVPLVFYYRVRTFSKCSNASGGYSKTLRVVVVPITNNGVIDVPAGTKEQVTLKVFIPGDGQNEHFTASADRPWIVNIQPANGIIPPAGITLDVTIDPTALPEGTFTATIILVFSPVTNGNKVAASNGKSVPVSINLVTPVVPMDPSQPTSNSLIIPAVGRLLGINSQWRSDVRIYNASPQALKYQVNFIQQGVKDYKQTIVDTASGETTALDDIVHNWYGVGEVGDNATGVLEIRPMTQSGDPNPPSSTSLATVVSSRTFDLRTDGTVGQFIPAVQFTKFAAGGSVMSMQQIAQSSSYRTNFGLYEGSGSPVSLVLSLFNAAGTKLFDLPVSLAGGEQKMLNSLLAQQGVTSLDDGRMEVHVNGGGKVTAYASVVDNASLDPQLVPAQNLGSAGAKLYVVPGVADLHNGGANWQTDLRVYNSAGSTQTATLTFFPLDNAGPPIAKNVDINVGEVKALNNIVQTLFGTSNVGGVVQVSTPADSQLVVTARTYDQLAQGTLGQFIRASTSNDAVPANGRSLNILQVEDSPRFRTNVGVAEMSGKPVTAEVSVILPDSKVTAIIDVPLGANEFRQFAVGQFGLGNIYNARINVKVIDGAGSVTAYGSVIDQNTTDPTYVLAQ